MIRAGSVDYAHARLWARNGRRPGEADWHRLEVVREFGALVDVARALPAFRDWIAGIGPGADAHEVEAKLREHWRAVVAEVAGWMPDAWRSPIAWCAALVDVPIAQYLADGGRVLPWMQRDPAYRDAAGDPPQTGALARFAVTSRARGNLALAWRDEWRRRVPRDALADPALLADLEGAFALHFRRFGAASIRDGWPLRRALQARLTALFRRAMLEPAAAFVFVALCALDFERLRGELLRRAVFPRLPLVT
jgi:hypothetical protein